MIVEDGSCIEGANSYVSLVYADDYFTQQGSAAWDSKSGIDKERALVKASAYIDGVFKWRGKRKTAEQSLSFPRTLLIDDDGYTVDGIPDKLKRAVCEAAVVAASGTELFNIDNANGAVTSERIGELSFSYDAAHKAKDTTLYEAINLRLRGLYIDTNKSKCYSGKVVRV